MKHLRFLGLAIAVLLTISAITSCKYELIAEPTKDVNSKKSAADYSDSILPPASISASQGGYKSITISWEEVANAVEYTIFSATTPFDDFEQIGETSDTQATFEVDAGTTLYYTVCAINYYGTVSAQSQVAMGSSLATPIITSIENDDSVSSFNVKWWMDNCSSGTYQDNVEFNISVFDANKKALDGYNKTVSGSNRTVDITGLTALTEYYFQVEAKIKDSEQKSEVSDKTNAQTAHKVTPDAVLDFTVSQGSSKEQTLLTWKLPEGVWYKASIFELHPVYFKIYRKLSTATEYELLDSIGCLPTSNWTEKKNANLHFDCESNKVYDSDGNEITYVSLVKDSNGITLDSPYKAYTSNSLISYSDTSCERGKQYDYYIQSFTDDTSKELSDESSLSQTLQGWKLASANFKLTDTINKTEGTTIDSIDLAFSSNFENFSTTYNYLITQTKKDLTEGAENQEEKFLYSTDDLTALNSYTITFDKPSEQAGYYSYKLYILAGDSTQTKQIPSEYLEVINANKTITVIDDESKIPSITNFAVKDGYKDKFSISWDKVEGDSIEYIISYIPVIDGIEDSLNPVENTLTASDYTEENGKITYNQAAESGDCRKYSLTVKKDGILIQSSLDQTFYTLGTAQPIFTDYDYSSITVSWKEVQMAKAGPENYSISALYSDDSENQLSNQENTKITYDIDSGLYSCVITNPAGYDDPSISGKDINFTITANSQTTEDSTNGSKIVRTLGPALIESSVNSTPNKDYMTFTWNAVEGAEKYLIYRLSYSDNNASNINASDAFAVKASSLDIVEYNSQDLTGRTTCTKDTDSSGNTIFTLKDMQKDAEENYGYQLNQEKIQWGLPYGYLVLPLKAEDSAKTFTFTDFTKFNEESPVNYGDSFVSDNIKKTSTIGYGLNVHAAKAESGSKIHVTWEKPNTITNLQPTIYKMAFDKEEDHDYGNVWEKVANLSSSDLEYEDTISNENAHLAYVYAVEYEPSISSDFVKSYRDNIAQDDTSYTFPDNVTEPSNKGYLFSIKGLSANSIDTSSDNDDYFQENLRWDSSWDFEERALCPTSFTVDMKNKNLSSTKDWIPIATVTIDAEGKFSISVIDGLESDWDTTVTISGAKNGISTKPTSLINGNATESNGLLKVLRDTKHYYSLNITGNGNTDRQAEDESIYAYRQVTDTELAKCVSVIVADAIYQTGIPTEPGGLSGGKYLTNTLNGYTGNMYIGFYGGGVSLQHKSSWGFENSTYTHRFINGASSANTKALISNFTITADKTDYEDGIADNKLYHLPALDLTISHESGLSSYKRVLNYEVGESGTSTKWTLTIIDKTNNNKTLVSIDSNESNFKNYFPYDLGTAHAEPITSVDSSLPIYSSPWWN
ncbi:MAG: hypothetical protein K5866_02800 [Treponema sp.]|nr:hypothetical protein [Treponema sp.]